MTDKLHDAGFDHPCRETCSGWKQGHERGYERGMTQFKKSQKDLVQERDELEKEQSEVSSNLREILDNVKNERNKLRAELEVWKKHANIRVLQEKKAKLELDLALAIEALQKTEGVLLVFQREHDGNGYIAAEKAGNIIDEVLVKLKGEK